MPEGAKRVRRLTAKNTLTNEDHKLEQRKHLCLREQREEPAPRSVMGARRLTVKNKISYEDNKMW